MHKELTSGFRLSPQQRRYWQLHRGGWSQLGNSQCCVGVSGRGNVAQLRRALADVAGNYDILRTTFRCPSGVTIPVQLVGGLPGIPVAEHHLWDVPPKQRWGRLLELYARARLAAFDLEYGPLICADLVHYAANRHYLLLAASPLCADGASMEILASAISRRYLLPGGPAAGPAETIQYPDFAEWQNALFEAPEASIETGYWKEHGRGSAAAKICRDRPFRLEHFDWSLEVGEDLGDAARRRRWQPRSLLQAAWLILLGRLFGESKLMLGVDADGRSYPALENAIGPISRVLPLPQEVPAEISGARLILRTSAALKEAEQYQEYFRAEDYFGPEEPLGYLPYGFSYRELRRKRRFGASWFRLELLDFASEPQQLKLACLERDNGHRARLTYDAERFDPRDAQRFAENLGTILRGLLADSRLPLGRLEIVGAHERRQLLEAFNATESKPAAEGLFHQLFERQADLTPDAIALQIGDRRLTYRHLNAQAGWLANQLGDRGEGTEMLVGLFMERSIEMVIALLGVLKAGAAYVPLDPGWPDKRLEFIVADSGISLVLSQAKLGARLSGAGAPVLRWDGSPTGSLGLGRTSRPQKTIDPNGLAYVIYTSGSTGTPKGVMVTQRGLVNYLSWCKDAYRLSEGAGTLVHSSLSFDLTVTGLLAPLLAGQRVVLVPEEDGAEGLGAAIRRERDLSLVKITPAHLELLGRQLASDEMDGRTRAFVIGGEALKPGNLSAWKLHAPQTLLINEYGPTETVVGCCVHTIVAGGGAAKAIPIGRPIANTQLYVLDDGLRPVPTGTPGELYVGGDGVARGYTRQPALTATRFIADPFSGGRGRRMYKTGDRVRHLPGGVIDFVGRIDQQVKIRGYRVELPEIECVLGRHECVRQNVVVLRPTPSESGQLVAYVVLRHEQAATPESLRRYLGKELPEYMVPTAIIVLEALPMSPNGKVDRGSLPEPAERSRAGPSPSSPVEAMLAKAMQEVLASPPVGLDDDFFALGGDSIKAILLAARLRRQDCVLRVADLFRHRTVKRLAPHLSRCQESIDQGPVTGPAGFTPIQKWFLETQAKDRHHFNQAVLVRPRLRYDLPALDRTLARLAEHHDALRLVLNDDEAALTILPPNSRPTACESTVFATPRGEAEIDRVGARLQSSLDLKRGPLMKAAVLRGPEEDVLLLVAHHLTVDGVSWRILLEDLRRGYASQLADGTCHFPPKTHSFQYWSDRLREYGKSKQLRSEFSHWLRICREISSGLPGEQRSDASMKDMAELRWDCEEGSIRPLLGAAHRAYNTEINDFLVAALGLALGEWLGAGRLRVHLEGHGREEIMPGIDINRTVGWFTSLYPVVLSLTANADPGRYLTEIKEMLRRVPGKGIGYGILRYLSKLPAGERDGLAAPIDLVFNYLGHLTAEGEGDTELVGAPQTVSPDAQMTGAINISGALHRGSLVFNFGYDRLRFKAAEIRALAGLYDQSLQRLIGHCLEQKSRRYTASDFGDLSLEEGDVEALPRPDEIESVRPGTPAQAGIYFDCEYTQHKDANKFQLSVELAGMVDPEVLSQSLARLSERQAALRTAFVHMAGKGLRQVVRREAKVDFRYEDAAGRPPTGDCREKFAADEYAGEFSLLAGRLFRVGLLKIAPEQFLLSLTWHHIILDGWSLPILLLEMFAIYRGFATGEIARLDPVWDQANYARWLRTKDPAEMGAFWFKYLEGYERKLDLGWSSPGNASYEVGQHVLPCNAALAGAIRNFVAQSRVTTSAVFQVAWGMVVQRYQGCRDVVFGNVISGRSGGCPGIERAVGMFINTVPLRFKTTEGQTLLNAVGQRSAESAQCEEMGLLSLAEIQERVGATDGRLIDHWFVFENYPAEDDAARAAFPDGEIRIKGMAANVAAGANHYFNVIVSDREGFTVKFRYNKRALRPEYVARLGEHYERAIRAVVESPAMTLAEVKWVSPTEREALLEKFSHE